MSVVFTNTPQQFQPVLSDGIFFTTSAATYNPLTTFKFRYVYELYVENELVFEGKCTPNPFGLGIIDLQQVLETYCFNNPIASWNGTPIYTHTTFPFSRPYYDETISYYIKCGYEYASSELGQISGFTGVGNDPGLPAYSSDVYKTFRSTMGVNGRANQQSFDIGPFVLSGSPTSYYPTTSGLFLTNAPRIMDIADSEYYTLGFTNYYLSNNILSEPYHVKYTFYDDEGVVITATTYENITTNGGGPRTSCSQVYQSLTLLDPITGTTDYNTLYVGAGPQNIPNFPPNCAQYTVQLFGIFEGETTPIQPTPTPTPTQSTPTPTPSFTPSPTPTPQGCSTCPQYAISWSGESPVSVFITNCDNGFGAFVYLEPGLGVAVCSCTVPTAEEPITVTEIGFCSVAVSSTPAPTATSTPTPSRECVEQYVFECTNTCVGGVCSCDSSFEVTVYAAPGVLPSDTGETLYTDCGLTEVYFGDYQYGGTIYTASPISIVCTPGGGC